MQTLSVPVVFWGHTYPGHPTDPSVDKFNIKYDPSKKSWSYTHISALRGDTPYTQWIHETFKPNYQKKEEGVECIMLVRGLIVKDGVPVCMKFGLQKLMDIPEELKKKVSEWKYWLNEPEPDTSMYYQDIDLDKEDWQCHDAKIKERGVS